MPARAHYERLAEVFEYPGAEHSTRIRKAREVLAGPYPRAAAQLDELTRLLPSPEPDGAERAVDELQEIYTRSFEVQSITTLDVGYVAFGDDYKRGEFLVNLNREHKAAGVDCGTELPDHLPNVLRLIARLRDQDMVAELVREIVAPAVQKMLCEFGSDRMEQRNALYEKHYKTLIVSAAERATLYRHPLAALLQVLEADFGPTDQSPLPQTNDFLSSIGREMEIEGPAAG